MLRRREPGITMPVRGGAPQPAQPAQQAEAPREKKMPKVGKNDPCPCGSGKLYRRCHGKDAAA